MTEVLNDIGHAWEKGIVDAGKVPEFLLYISFLLTFAFIRFSTHMIRAQVSWWPGNVSTKGGTHIHHMVFGIIGLLVVGYLSLALQPDPPIREVLAVLFGIAAGLTLDEFALWLHLEDVYWSEKGRQSIDAVIMASVLGGIVLLGIRVWLDVGRELESVIAGAGIVGLVLAAVNVAKGKLVMAALSFPLAVPVGLVGAFRLARPESAWARWFYKDAKERRAKDRFPEPWLPARLKARRRRPA